MLEPDRKEHLFHRLEHPSVKADEQVAGHPQAIEA
jgi:hypothetical protein